MKLGLLGLLAMAPLAFGQQGSIAGTVVDTSGASVASAQVKLSIEGRGSDRETKAGAGGEFTFADVTPGPYKLSFTAKGFAVKTIAGELPAGESANLPPVALAVDAVNTEVNVTQTQVELAQAQIKVQEQQRLVGLVPNFFTSYDRDAQPLNAKQKLELAGKTWLDPSSFVINGIIAGVQQAENTHKGFGQGAQGYAKRYGAGFADFGVGLMLEKLVMPTIFKQDPRYFYKGTGTTRERVWYAISRSVICRGDNKKEQFCYSTFVNRFGAGFATNYLYPAADRDSSGLIVRNAFIGIGADAINNLFQEFIARKITKKH